MTMVAGPAPALSSSVRWTLRLTAVVWFVLAMAWLASLPVLLDLSPFALPATLVLAAALVVPVGWLARRLFTTQRRQARWLTLVKCALALSFSLGIALAAPLYLWSLRTDLTPLTVPQAVLTNGERVVVFQGMLHIGSEGFYKSVVYDVEAALADGYVAYYEGVRPSPEGDEWFRNAASGGEHIDDGHKRLADACGLQFQLDYFDLLKSDMAANPDRHVAADVTTFDLKREYERLMANDTQFVRSLQTSAPAGTNFFSRAASALLVWLQDGSPQQGRLGNQICRGILTDMLSNQATDTPINRLLIDFRNEALAQRILSEPNPHIYMTYGSQHLEGLLAVLQRIDPTWHIASIRWQRPIESEQQLSGSL